MRTIQVRMFERIDPIMQKKLGLYIIVCLIIVICIVFANSSTTVPDEVKQLYIDYMETIKSDYEKAVNEYCYFEVPIIEELTKQSTEYITEYEILSWQKLSDHLWVVNTFFKTEYIPNGETMFNFIGVIEGKYYVMLNAYQVPVQLRENIDLSQYIPPNVIPYEDVVGLLG